MCHTPVAARRYGAEDQPVIDTCVLVGPAKADQTAAKKQEPSDPAQR